MIFQLKRLNRLVVCKMDLFTPIVPVEKQHPLFRMLLEEKYAPERQVLISWAKGFQDRDGKFVQEFQKTFESSFWELYLFEASKLWRLEIDSSFASPDFVVTSPVKLCIEATIAAPAKDSLRAYGADPHNIPEDFEKFNAEAAIRICNSFSSKVKRYRAYYKNLPHVSNHPFVIAIAAFDRPYSHFAAGRSIMAAMYGVYYDEENTPPDADYVINYNVESASKSETVDIKLGMFCDNTYEEVSAVIYSSLVTWGKIRALSENPAANTNFHTLHSLNESIYPEERVAPKADYSEHLFDGLIVLHNPFARNPIPPGTFSHSRLAEIHINYKGEIQINAPKDFLLVRMLMPTLEKN